MSSIGEGINGTTLANEIRLSRSKHKGSFLLVEGVSDVKMFSEFCDQHDCSIVPCMGKAHLLDAITELDKTGFCGALGFADRDFDQFIGSPNYKGNVVFTDENDMEMMILCSSALDIVLSEFGNQKKISDETEAQNRSVSELIFVSASVVGKLRLMSQQYKWSLLFEGMTYKFVSNNSYILDEKATVSHVLGRSKVKVNMTESEIVTLVDNRKSVDGSNKNLCCGHDCIRVLGKALKSKFGNKNQFNSKDGIKILEGILRVAYKFEYFQLTKACKEIRKWEEASGYNILR